MRILNYIVISIGFALLAGAIITYALGYKVNLSTRNVNKTAIIEVRPDISDASVILNGRDMGKGRLTFRYLTPGRYEIKVVINEYHDFVKQFDLKGGEAVVIDDIIMFRKSPVAQEFDFNGGQKELSKIADIDNLSALGGEIYENGNLVTRLSTDVKGLCWYDDRRYVAFTNDNLLKIININGTNEIDLLKKNSDGPVVFVNSGRSVIYESDGKIYRVQIR